MVVFNTKHKLPQKKATPPEACLGPRFGDSYLPMEQSDYFPASFGRRQPREDTHKYMLW